MKNGRRILTLLLAAAMVFALAACGETNVEETEAPEFVYKADYLQVGPVADGASFYPTLATKDAFYSLIWLKTGERELEEGEVLEYDGQLDIYEPRLFRMDYDGKITAMEQYRPFVPEKIENHSIYANTNSLIQRDGGGFLELVSVGDSWLDVEAYAAAKGIVGPVTEFVYDDVYYDNWHNENTYLLRTLDADGALQSSVKLDLAPVIETVGYDSVYFYNLVQTDDAHVLVAGDGGLFLYDIDSGEMAGRINGFEYCESMLRLNDGRIVAGYYGDHGQAVAVVDLEKKAKGQEYLVQGDIYRVFAGSGDYDFCYNNGVNLIGFDLDAGEKGEAVKILNWINCDVDNDNISGFYMTEDGKVITCSSEWDAVKQQSNSQLITMSKVSSDTLPKKEVLTLACQYLDWNARKFIIDFNRSHESVRIELHDYSEYNTDEDYEAGLTKLRTEMLAGNCPDIIDLNGLPAKQLAAKGLLADLYPLLDADPELSREDFFPMVLHALENNGKLYSTCSGFTVLTAVGASKVVGTEPGWTYEELMAALKEMPEGCSVFSQSETRYDVLQLCLMLDMDRYVDWNTGRVEFDSPDFISLLNFVKSFPAEFDWEHYEWSEDDSDYNRIRDGKQLLIYEGIYGFDNIINYENVFGGLDAFTYIGFPTSSGVGNLLMAGSGYGISEKCQNKEAAWEFVRVFLTEEYQESNSYNLPSNIHRFEQMKTDAMTPSYYKDDEGHILLDPETGEKLREEKGGYWDNEKEEWVPIYSYSKEEIAKLEEVIYNTDRLYVADEAINEIVKEQVEAFFAGQRSAEDVAKLIQSKAMIYVNEQR